MSTVKNDKYNPAVDLLRILSIFSVLMIHTSTKVLEYSGYNLSSNLLILFLNQASRFAVPLFFLISAFVLELNYPQNVNYFSYIKKRFSRLFLPYLFWSAIYYFIIYTDHSKSFFNNLLLGDASYQLYFVPALFIFHLIFPLLHHFIKFFANKFIILAFGLIQIVLLVNDYYFSPLFLPHPIGVFLLNFDIFILGILAFRYQKNILSSVKKYYFIFMTILLVMPGYIFYEGFSLYQKTGNYLFFYSNWRPSVYVYTLVLGAFLYYVFNQIKLNYVLVRKLASYSFFIFFIHVIYIEILWRYLPHAILSFPLILFLLVSILSCLLAFLVSKVPYLSKLTG